MPTTQVRMDSEVYERLTLHAESVGALQSRLVSIAVAKWLKEQGVEIDYPRLRSNPLLANRRATDRTPTPPTAA